METLDRAVYALPPAPAKPPPLKPTPSAFVSLIRQNEPSLLRASRRLCQGQEDQSQDLVQETLLRAYEAFLDGRYQEGSNGSAWLLRILTNLAINDYHHRRKFASRVDLETLTSAGEAGPVQTHAAAADVPGVSLLADTLDEELEQALACLSERLRRCVILVDIEGLEYVEAATALQVPIGTVRSRLSRARLQLCALLHQYGQARRLL